MSDNEKEIKKLKTLKDIAETEIIQNLTSPYITKRGELKNVRVDDLRSAAREWIKELEKDVHDSIWFCVKDSDGKMVPAKIRNRADEIDWIKHFFNLEDDK